jgi:predicted lipoprotein with Yx(FWY)xxD motif
MLLVACKDSQVVDNGGRSLDVPVPSRGVAADTKNPGTQFVVRPKRTRRDPSRLGVGQSPLGQFLVDANGLSLYAFSGDGKDQTACVTNCAAVWPAVIVDRLPETADASIDRALVTTIARPDGKRQLAYAGIALYYSESDLQPGDTWGHYAMSFGGRFSLVTPAGKPLAAPN